MFYERVRTALVGRLLVSLVAAAVVVPVMNVGPAVADELGVPGELQAYVQSPNGSYVEKVRAVDDQHLYVFVHSASMDKTVPVQVQRPDDTSAPRPVLYLLNGAGGGEDLASWTLKTDALQFLADKKVNVVTPGGRACQVFCVSRCIAD